MNRDKPDTTTHAFEALSVFRGIYKRVAIQLDVDPSYVSRVARGQRHAPFVSEALRKEIQRVLGKAGLQDGNGGKNGHNHNRNHNHGGLSALLDGHGSEGHAKNGHPVARRKEKRSAPSRRKK
jgi:hypothetical protein